MAEEQEAPKPVTSEEMDIIYSGPAVLSNKIYLTVGGPIARLTFAEHQPGRDPKFRASVAMTIADLLKLKGLIERLTKDAKLVEVEVGGKKDG